MFLFQENIKIHCFNKAHHQSQFCNSEYKSISSGVPQRKQNTKIKSHRLIHHPCAYMDFRVSVRDNVQIIEKMNYFYKHNDLREALRMTPIEPLFAMSRCVSQFNFIPTAYAFKIYTVIS